MFKDEVDLEAGMDRSGLSHFRKSLLLGHLTYSMDDRESFLGLRGSQERSEQWVWNELTELLPHTEVIRGITRKVTKVPL